MAWLRHLLTTIGAFFRLLSGTSIESPKGYPPLAGPPPSGLLTGPVLDTRSMVGSVGFGKIANCIHPGRKYQPLQREKIGRVFVHHCSLSHMHRPIADDVLDAGKLVTAFTNNKELGTGGAIPYHGILTIGGELQQVLPLSAKGAHAANFNSNSLSWCVIGEKDVMPWVNTEKLANICALLLIYIRGDITQLVGHSEVPGASRDPNKKCPWPTVNMDRLRYVVAGRLPPDLQSWSMGRCLDYVKKEGLIVE